jgi:hydrogenase expression/formation protein HypC
MCLGIPGEIIEIAGNAAKVSLGGSIINVSLHLIDDAIIGDYVLVHTGFALQKIDKQEALETLKLLNDLMEPI